MVVSDRTCCAARQTVLETSDTCFSLIEYPVASRTNEVIYAFAKKNDLVRLPGFDLFQILPFHVCHLFQSDLHLELPTPVRF